MRNTDKLNRCVQYMHNKRLKSTTINQYKSALVKFFTWANEDSSRISKQRIQDYIYQKLEHTSPSAQNQIVSAIKMYFKFIENRDFTYFDIPRPKAQAFIPNILTYTQVRAVIDNTANIKHRCLLNTIYDNGLRISEVLKLKIIDVRSKATKPHLIIREAKHNSARIIPASEQCIELIREYYRIEKPHGFLFEGDQPGTPYSKSSIRNLFNDALQREHITMRVRVHDLRHAFATHCLEAGMDIYHLSKILGHKSVKTTESYYSHLRTDQIVVVRPQHPKEQTKLRIVS